jgi:iron complex outermembrane receptor protein
VRAGTEAGSFGTSKEMVSAGARIGAVGGNVTASRLYTDGFRQQSAADQRRLAVALNWNAPANTVITLRLSAADDPRARNPGALTAAELAANRDSASAANIRRGADKDVTQTQLALGMHHQSGRIGLDVTLYGLARGLDNPLATPPPPPAAANEGTWVGIDRRLGGARASATLDVRQLTITAGVDVQGLRDDRVNRRSVGGVPTSVLLLDQRERVSEFGAFAQVAWPVTNRVTVRGGARDDLNRFSVTDHLLTDGDASGRRNLHAASGNVGVSIRLNPRIIAWTDVGTVFETPTTTELANRPDGAGGFNPDLNPQRSLTTEAGIRGTLGRVALEVAAYHTTTRDAIVPFSEVAGRTFFRNAGKTRTQGAEASIRLPIHPGLAILATWTFTDAIFSEYRVVNPSSVDTLDGRQLAGLPRHVARIGLQGALGHGFAVDVDHAFASSMFGDDRNTIPVAGWGAGVTGARLSWHGHSGRVDLAPFVVATNIFNREYVGSVTTNGAFGRVFEPAAGRAGYIGMSVTASGRQ